MNYSPAIDFAGIFYKTVTKYIFLPFYDNYFLAIEIFFVSLQRFLT